MGSVNRAAVIPKKSRLARTFAKVLHIRAMAGVSAADGVQKAKKHDPGVQKTKACDQVKHDNLITYCKSVDEEDENIKQKEAIEAFLAKLFASVSSIKAAYAQMQYSQSPYDGEGIQSADEMVVSELKILSELKQCHLKKHYDDSSPKTSYVKAEIQEQKSLSKTFEIMTRKLDSELKLKKSELCFLREKLDEANSENKLLEKRMNSSGQLSDNVHFSSLSPGHFIACLKQTIKSVRSFVRLIVDEMESSDWDLEAAVDAIEPCVTYSSPSHKCFAFESFVCREMFDGFNYPYFSFTHEPLSDDKRRQQFFDRFIVMKSHKSQEYLARKPKSAFAKFCRTKYFRLVHPKMEASLFGNLNHRNLLGSGNFPETSFFAMFSEMAKRVWLLHCLAFAFQPEVSIYQASKKSRFSDVYMECLNEEAFVSSDGSLEAEPRVGLTVIPGFKIGKTVIQAQVYLG